MNAWESIVYYGTYYIPILWTLPFFISLVKLIQKIENKKITNCIFALITYTLVMVSFFWFENVERLNIDISDKENHISSLNEEVSQNEDKINELENDLKINSELLISITEQCEEYEHIIYGTTEENPFVFINPNGSKYHWSFCTYVDDESLRIILSDAVSAGYSPCSKCQN